MLRSTGQKTRVSVANAIWYRLGYKPDLTFLKQNADFFNAGAQALDFDKQESLNTMNNWVKENTQGKIEKIVDQINKDVRMYIMNAVYFKSDWQTPFKAQSTYETDFNTAQDKVKVKMMHRTGEMQYIDKDGAKGIILPYIDTNFSFFAIMPEENTDLRDFVSKAGRKFFKKLSGCDPKR